MPETYSNGRHKIGKDAAIPPWCSLNLDWPFETVVVEAETVTSREPNPLEWAVVTILQTFQEQPPNLAEAAEELGINDPVFFTETLGNLLESGAVEKRDPEGNLDFSNCRLTSAGEAFMSQQQLSSLAERHGIELCFDIVTGEHLMRLPRGCRAEPKNPIIPVEQLPEPRTNIGLDTARKLAKAQDEPFLTAQSKLTNVNVQHEQGSIVWRSYEVRLSIDARGTISCMLRDGTQNQQQWLDQLDLRHEIVERLLSSSVNEPGINLSAPAKKHDQWRRHVDKLISPLHVASDAATTIRSARRQVMAHRYWLSIPEVRNELLRAKDRGVNCTLFGQSPQGNEIIESPPDSMEVIQRPEPAGLHDELMILTDESRGLAIDRVELTTPTDRKIEAILASYLKAIRVTGLQQGLQVQTASNQTPINPLF